MLNDKGEEKDNKGKDVNENESEPKANCVSQNTEVTDERLNDRAEELLKRMKQ